MSPVLFSSKEPIEEARGLRRWSVMHELMPKVKMDYQKVFAVLAGVGSTLLVFALYLRTLAPTVLPLEIPELPDTTMLQMQVCTLSIPHPTGYPTYIMLSHLFTYLPFGDCAYGANLASAVYAALTVAAIYAAGLLLSRRVVAAAAGAVAFGLGTTFWSQAVVAEVYTLNALFVALTLIALFLWRSRRRDGYLVLAAFCTGLSMTNHMTSALLLPGALLFVALVDWRKLTQVRLVLKGAGAFLLGLLPYLYLPIRTIFGAPMVANKPDNLERFWYVVSGGDLTGNFFAFGPAELPGRLAFYGDHLLNNFNWGLLVTGMVGFGALLLWDRATAALTGFLFLGWTFYAIENDLADVQLSFIPTYLVFALWVSLGLGLVLEEVGEIFANSRRVRVAAIVVLSAVILALPLPGVRETYVANDWSQNYEGPKIIEDVAENAAPGATVLHYRSVLWYMVLVEERRTDLKLVDAFQGYNGRYNDVVWPGDSELSVMKERYGLEDIIGVAAAKKISERSDDPLYMLARGRAIPENFREEGFRVVQVEGELYELFPSQTSS